MTENVEVPRNLLNRLLDRVEDLEAELSQYRENNEKDKAEIRQEVYTETEDTEEGRSPGSNPQGKSAETLSPMERIAEYPDDHSVVADVTASVDRAKEIFDHFDEWSQKAPSGRVIKSNLKTLLTTATGERIAWRQVYRACEKLEEWTKGQIRMKKTQRHGWILIEDQSSSVSEGPRPSG